MKNMIIQGKKLLITLMLSGMTFVAFSQGGPPPPPGDSSGGNSNNTENNQLGGSAHVGGGVLILLSLAMAYGGRRFYEFRKEHTK